MKENFNFTKVPEPDFLYPYVILALYDLEGRAKPKEVVAALSRKFNLSRRLLLEKIGRGNEGLFNNKVAFARLYLVNTGYIDNKEKGTWYLSDKGKRAAEFLIEATEDELNKFRRKVSQGRKEHQKIQNKKFITNYPKLTKIPAGKFFYPYILITLHKNGGSATKAEVSDLLGKEFKMDPDLLAQKTESGQDRAFSNKLAWARNDLADTGYIDRKTKGTWLLSDKGEEAVEFLMEATKDEADKFREKVSQEKLTSKTPKEKHKRASAKSKEKVSLSREESPPLEEEDASPTLEKKMERGLTGITGVPKQKYLYPYILLALHKAGGSATKREVIDILTDKLSLTEGQLNMKTKDGNDTQFVSNIGFARQKLVYAGYISNETRGTWLLSTRGKEAVEDLIDEKKENMAAFVEKVIQELKPILQGLAKKEKEQSSAGNTSLLEEEERPSPLEEQQCKDLNRIKNDMDHLEFERLCVRLCREYGYEAELTKRTSDGGIDGFGPYKMGLMKFNMVLQAKRYAENKISVEKIRELEGSRSHKKAEKAIFITTSDFTKEAREYAKSLGITLVNGVELIRLLYEKRVYCEEVYISGREDEKILRLSDSLFNK